MQSVSPNWRNLSCLSDLSFSLVVTLDSRNSEADHPMMRFSPKWSNYHTMETEPAPLNRSSHLVMGTQLPPHTTTTSPGPCRIRLEIVATGWPTVLNYAYLLTLPKFFAFLNRAEDSQSPCLPSVAILNIKFLFYFTVTFAIWFSFEVSGWTWYIGTLWDQAPLA